MSAPHAIPSGPVSVPRWVAETASTNTDVLELARAGAPEGTVVVADHQTAGRGRLGRRWLAPPGASLLVSVLVRPDLPAGDLHLVTTVMALSVADACAPYLGDARPLVKWPNDVVIEAGPAPGKLAGILAESQMVGDRASAVVVGVGLNVNWPATLPAEIEGIATALNRARGGSLVDRPRVLSDVLEAFWPQYAAVVAGERAGVEAAVRERSATLGRVVQADVGGERLEGEAVAITAEGHLVLDTAAGIRTVVVGDVSRVRVAG